MTELCSDLLIALLKLLFIFPCNLVLKMKQMADYFLQVRDKTGTSFESVQSVPHIIEQLPVFQLR